MIRRALSNLPIRTTPAAPDTQPASASSLTPSLVERFQGPLADLQTQRIWVLERGTPWRADDDICGYAGAVLVLWADRVYGLVVRSPEPQRASDIPLREGRLRVNLDRDAFSFSTLDEAVNGMARVKQALIARGWVETDNWVRHS